MAPTNLSGSYQFSPSFGELVLYAFGLCGIRRTAIVQEHLQDAHMAVNLMQADWLNEGVNLWQVELITIPLVFEQATYDLDPSVLVLLDGYVSTATDRIVLPIGRSEYAAYPNKAQLGVPTVFWMDRLIQPTVTLWPVPDGNETSVSFYALRQPQDANYDSGQQPEVPFAWLKAAAYGLAEGLAPSYAPDKFALLHTIAADAYAKAAAAGVETAQQYISPVLSSYFRN